MKYNKKTKLGIRSLTYCTLISASILSANQVHAATDSAASTTSTKASATETTEYQTENQNPTSTNEPSQATIAEDTTETSTPETSTNSNVVRATSESIDDWMPDKNLQKAVAAQYGITVSELTKDYINSHNDSETVYLNLTDDENLAITDSSYYYVKNLKGLESISRLFCEIKLFHTVNDSMSIDMSYLLALKTNRSVYHLVQIINKNADFTNFSLFWDYLNYSSQSALDNSGINVELTDDSSLGRSSSVSGEATFSDYNRLVIPISKFYKKGTDFSLDPGYNIATLFLRPDREPSDYDLDFDQSDDLDSRNFLNYVLLNDGHNDLVYAVFLENDNLVFKLRKGSIENIGSPIHLTTNFNFTHTKVALFSSLISGYYTFSTNVALDVQVNSAIISSGTVKVNYEDEHGNSIASPETLSGSVGAPYTSVQKSIPGYTFRRLKAGSASATGVFTSSEQVVTYVYSQNITPYPANSTSLTVHYQDTEGNKIAESKTIFGNIGDNYDVSENAGYKLNIAGYTFKEIRGIPTGTLAATEQTVIYVYTKDQTDKPKEEPKIEVIVVNKEDKRKNTDKRINQTYKNNTNRTTPTEKNTLPKTGKSSGIAQVLAGIAVLFTTFGAWLFKRKQ